MIHAEACCHFQLVATRAFFLVDLALNDCLLFLVEVVLTDLLNARTELCPELQSDAWAAPIGAYPNAATTNTAITDLVLLIMSTFSLVLVTGPK